MYVNNAFIEAIGDVYQLNLNVLKTIQKKQEKKELTDKEAKEAIRRHFNFVIRQLRSTKKLLKELQ